MWTMIADDVVFEFLWLVDLGYPFGLNVIVCRMIRKESDPFLLA